VHYSFEGSFAKTMLMAGALADQVLHKYGQIEEKYDVDVQSFLSSSPSSALEAGGVFLVMDKNKDNGYTATQAVTMVTLAVGLWQAGMSILRLGAFSVLLSDVLVSGFTRPPSTSSRRSSRTSSASPCRRRTGSRSC
jgi:MFS superfamily sulfate permease-like transporter